MSIMRINWNMTSRRPYFDMDDLCIIVHHKTPYLFCINKEEKFSTKEKSLFINLHNLEIR